MNGSDIHVLGIAGSLRERSYNKAAIRAAAELAPDGMTVEACDLRGIPLYDDDLRQAEGYPEAVQTLREKMRAADAVLIATPEYNYSMPGVLKNAIDWASRPPDQPFDGKPVAIMSAAPGRLGGVRAQYHLRQSFVFLNALVMNKPEVMIANARDMFDDDLALTDAATRDMVAKLMAGLATWTRRTAAIRSGSKDGG